MFAKFYTAYFGVLLISFSSFAQQDSLLVVLDTAQAEYKVKTLNELFRANMQSDPVKALAYTREALGLALEIQDKKGIGASYNNLGVAYRNQGAFDKALEYYIKALAIYEELNNIEGVATLKNNISNIYSVKKEYGQAMRYLEESYELFVQAGDQQKIIGSMNNLGNLNLDLQLYEKALKNYSEAYQLSLKAGTKFPDPVNNIGNIYFRQGNYQKAIENYLMALEIEREHNNRVGILNSVTNIGIAFAKAGQPKAAEQYLEEAETLVQELEAFSFLPSILKLKSEILFKQGNSSDAYLTFVKYDSLREVIYGEESTRKIVQMELVLDFQEKEKELDMLKKEGEIQTLQLRNSRLFIVMMILGILIIIGVINLYFMGNKKRLIRP